MTPRLGWSHVVRPLLIGCTVATLVALPAAAAASTGPETPPPSSMLPCALGTSAAVAGTPLEIRGTTTSGDAVNASAWRDGDKTVREATVATLDGTWRAIFLFGAADGGEWTVQVSVDGTECASRLTVALPPGMVAPPTAAPAPEPDGSSSGGFDGYALRTLAVNDGVALVLASWIFLALVRLVHTTGRRPLARPGVRRVATVAVFVAVLGAVLAVWIGVHFFDGMSHFDDGIPAGLLLLRQVGDKRLRREDHRGDGRGILEGRPRDLGGVHDALLEYVAVVALEGVEAVTRGQHLDALDDDFAVRAGVVRDLSDRCLERAAQDAEAHRFVAHELDQVERRDGLEQGHAAARDQALFDRCAGGGERVLDAVLLLLELDLGARTGRQGVHDRPADRGDTRSRSARAR